MTDSKLSKYGPESIKAKIMALDNFSLGLSSEVESNFEFNSNTKQHEPNAKRIQTDYNSTRFSSSKKLLGYQNVDAKSYF